jgi:hypothetical protein
VTQLSAFAARGCTSVTGSLEISGSALTGLGFPALTTLGGALSLIDNPALPQCTALAFKDHLVAVHGYPGAWTISGNDTTASCPQL